ncbi:hypothetical protein [Stenotrophomonas sp. Marseille-Q4652]|uniref:hypothetical protein n=1 Tax=Stenotrophomonas sp. Marseille-Q4652 TaxID=2866595 RepID=UPI001CE47F04|nr:hypothetical protein [Stenotrophomonas sp. Marseille-Q4652]
MQDVILAVLRVVREAGLGRINRTTLIKLIYLLDCLHAETHEGETASGSAWYFYSYGPFATDLVGAVSEMASRGIIHDYSAEYGDQEYTQYWLGEFPLGPTLSDVGLAPAQAARFGSLIRKFRQDLSGLLDHTYFKTLPMQLATPGQNIDFSVLRGVGEVKPHHQVGITDQTRLMRILQLGANLERKYADLEGNARAMAAHRPIYDRAYSDGMTAMDAELQNEPDIQFTALLS